MEKVIELNKQAMLSKNNQYSLQKLNEALRLIPSDNNDELLGLTYNNIGCVYKQR